MSFSRAHKERGRLPASIVMLLVSAVAAAAQQSITTFNGRVTDQATGQGIPGVAVVALGDQTGTRVTLSDAQGNYSLPFGPNTNIRLRAYKTGLAFNPAVAGFSSVGGSPITGTHVLDFSGGSSLVLIQPPILLTEDDSLKALVLDGSLHTRDPFRLVNNDYLGTDKRTRIQLFLVDLDLRSGETLSIVSVHASDAQQLMHNLPVEDMRKTLGLSWLTQLTVRLPENLTRPNELTVSVSARGQASNTAKVKIE